MPTSSTSTTYTLYTYYFTANSASATLAFTANGDHGGGGNFYYLLDSVSVYDVNASSSLLINGGFETGDLTGWTGYCNTTTNCGTVYYAHIVGSPCQAGSYCIYDSCASWDYLEQSFTTVIGDYHLVSFYLRSGANGGGSKLYVMLF